MAKVTTFSRCFPKYHPRSGEATYFVEQILNQRGIDFKSKEYLEQLFFLNQKNILNKKLTYEDLICFQKSLNAWSDGIKHHTIRNGFRYKQGEYFSPRVWSKNPYNSPQIIFLPLTIIEKTINIAMYATGEVMINNRFYCTIRSGKWSLLSKNDGLDSQDMRNWFLKMPFKGQIISWSTTINY